ncbi:hypothetical protein VP496E541_P0130 [Vibrio phage 496E54-1]|nr:hypothetical protein VP495E541_P0129 [Vibrio phage 495E54-1]CAH9013832.1 hypothetical protein VP496E541_P0130 [Vibrio phage 496E54-1]
MFWYIALFPLSDLFCLWDIIQRRDKTHYYNFKFICLKLLT